MTPRAVGEGQPLGASARVDRTGVDGLAKLEAKPTAEEIIR
jgi:hypothetical protein